MIAAEPRSGQQSPRRILCIDGGGIMGAFPAAFLASLEKDLGRPIGEYFDLIAGTSTGGILAIGLGLGLTAKELVGLYSDRGPYIFGDRGTKLPKWLARRWRSIRWSVRPKHDSKRLRAELQNILKDKRIGDSKTRLLIPAWDADHRGVYIFKTAHHQRLKSDYRSTAVDAAMATAAAPTFFQQHRTAESVGLLDGGVWANNPIALAVVEAITLLGWPAEDISVLSIGCVNEIYMLGEAPGFSQLIWDVSRLFMDGQSHGAMGIAKLLTGHEYRRKAIFRYCADAPRNFFTLDDTDKIQRLIGLGSSAARQARPHIEPVFFSEPAEPFTPIYTLKD